MLGNSSASSIITDARAALATYLRTLKEHPNRLVSLLAVLIISAAALGWWFYSFAMSLDAVKPLQPAADSSELQVSDPQKTPEAVTDSQATAGSSSEKADGNSSTNIHSSEINVEIDGQTIPVPENGSTHQVIQNDNGKTTVDISVDSDTSGSNKTRTSTDIRMKSSSSSDIDIKSKEVQ